jgi:hypothetical protein
MEFSPPSNRGWFRGTHGSHQIVSSSLISDTCGIKSGFQTVPSCDLLHRRHSPSSVVVFFLSTKFFSEQFKDGFHDETRLSFQDGMYSVQLIYVTVLLHVFDQHTDLVNLYGSTPPLGIRIFCWCWTWFSHQSILQHEVPV